MMKFSLFAIMLFVASVFSYNEDDYSDHAQLSYLTCLETYKWNFLKYDPFTNAINTLLTDTSRTSAEIIGDVKKLVNAVISGLTTTPPECTSK
jgi:hypothetical protein